MHEIPCSQHQCWLKEFCTKLPGQRCPRFCIGEEVEAVWFSEERAIEMCDRGIVVGLTSELDGSLIPGFWYYIRFSHIAECDWLPPGHCDWVHESEVRGKSDAL